MGELHGDISTISKNQIKAIEALYDYRMDFNQFASKELLREMARLSHEIDKEIAVYINRRGIVNSVSVGTEKTAPCRNRTEEALPRQTGFAAFTPIERLLPVIANRLKLPSHHEL